MPRVDEELYEIFVLLLLINMHTLSSEEIGKSKFNTMIGLVDRQRVDEELYEDYETAKHREVFLLLISILFYV